MNRTQRIGRLFLCALVAVAVESCSASPSHVAEAQRIASDAAGAELWRWAASGTDCAGLGDDACADRVLAEHEALWRAWDAYAALQGVEADVVNDGGAPAPWALREAACAVVAAAGPGAPARVRGLCPWEPRQ